MKSFYYYIGLLLAVLLPLQSLADDPVTHGGPNRMWTVPTVFEVDQPVTFYFDMTDAGFREGVDLYLWCWNPSEPDAGNWENSSDFAKLTYEEVYAAGADTYTPDTPSYRSLISFFMKEHGCDILKAADVAGEVLILLQNGGSLQEAVEYLEELGLMKEEDKAEDKKEHYLRREFNYSNYEQTYMLPEDVDKDKISAKVENGILTVELPKVSKETEKEDNKCIEVK